MTTPPPTPPTPTPGLVDYLPTDYPDTPPALPAPPAVPVPAALPPPAPAAPRLAITAAARTGRRGPLTWGVRQLLIAAAVAVVLVLLAVTITAVTSDSTTPDTPIQELFTALSHNDGAALTRLDICDDSPLCTDHGLTSGYQPPQHVHMGPAVLDNAGHATITVHYDLDGTGHDDPIGVTGTRHGIIGRHWTITEPPGATLHLHSSYWDTAHLAGIDTRTDPTTMTTPNNTSTTSGVWAPPGRFTLTTHADPLVEGVHTDITVAGDHHDLPIELAPTIRPDIPPQIDQQIHTRIDQCAGQPSPHPTVGQNPLDTIHSCPFTVDVPYTITDSPHWTINRYPAIALQVDKDGTISVTTTTPGEAAYRLRWTLDIVPPQHWTNATITTPITISGHITLDQNRATWTPQ